MGGPTRWRGGAVAGLLAVVVVALGACSSGSTSGTSTTSTTPTTAANATLPDITHAVVAFQNSQGIALSHYVITAINVSTVDPTWAKFSIGPSSTDRASFQGGYGFVHLRAGGWRVVGFGSAEVGCPLTGSTTPAAATYVTVPAAVLAAFGLGCPPGVPAHRSTTTAAATGATTTTTASPVAAVTAVVNAYQMGQGIEPAQYAIISVAISTVDPAGARFSVGPTGADQVSFQGGYGFAHHRGGSWAVVGFGSAEVGCPPGAPGNAVVPAAVLAGFNLWCPTTAT